MAHGQMLHRIQAGDPQGNYELKRPAFGVFRPVGRVRRLVNQDRHMARTKRKFRSDKPHSGSYRSCPRCEDSEQPDSLPRPWPSIGDKLLFGAILGSNVFVPQRL